MNSDLENKVLGVIQEESYRNYFFQNVKSIKWFYPLKEHNFFSPENIPNPLKVEDGYQIPFWMPLLYLERVSLQIKEGKYTQYIKEILSIINEVSQAKKENYEQTTAYYELLAENY